MSRTQSFPKLVRHLNKSRHLILLKQPYSQCLAYYAKMLTTRKLQKVQQATLKEWKLYCSTEALQVLWELTCLVPWPNEALTYLQVPMELFGSLEGSLQIKNNLEAPTLVHVQGYVQDGFGIFQNTPHYSNYLLVKCRDVWTSLVLSRSFHTLPICG